jgi:hypothetical protein
VGRGLILLALGGVFVWVQNGVGIRFCVYLGYQFMVPMFMSEAYKQLYQMSYVGANYRFNIAIKRSVQKLVGLVGTEWAKCFIASCTAQ